MPVKEFFQKFQPVQLYVILALTILFFIAELIVSHLTHALTLLMDSYHMLCNIMALTGCIVTIKYGSVTNPGSAQLSDSTKVIDAKLPQDKNIKMALQARAKKENKLRNTFGWTRVDVITMLICCVFLASFAFSIYVEALQTLVHIDHQDAMHHPIPVLFIGSAGLLLNGLSYLLIGGYTFHQGSFLHVTENGDVVLSRVVVNTQGGRQVSTSKPDPLVSKKFQGFFHVLRDVIGSVLVIICSIAVIFTGPQVSKFIDPLISLVSATSIMCLSYPYIKESCMILLQTMPDTINIDTMKKELMQHFPDIINVHDFHIWQLTASKIITTVHIIFENPKVYQTIMDQIKEFFLENGVTQVTIQPEFFKPSTSLESLNSEKFPPTCLVACLEDECRINHCCTNYEELSKFKSTSKEIFSNEDQTTPTLKSVKIISEESSVAGSSISLNSSAKSDNKLNSVEERENTIEAEEPKTIPKPAEDIKL